MIGILGGTFDPIHNGHIHIATQVVKRLNLEQLQFMPCALPVHRGQPRVSAEHRCAMIERVLAEHPVFALNTLELERGGPSYSVDSLRQIRQKSEATLVLILGADAFNGFARWKMPEEILRLAHLVVCFRPGIEVDSNLYRDHRVETPIEMSKQPTGAILLLEVDAIDCSSSAVRATLDAGELAAHYLHPAVASYIEDHHLYRKPSD
jgi:nicotinate-nucleotide adenylyltransferase